MKGITPTIKIACEAKAKAIAVQITEQTVKEYIENVEYESLVNLEYNEEGKIIAINANIIEMNKLSSSISYKIQERLMHLEKVNVEIPIGKIMGWGMFSGYGPDIKVKLVPLGNIESSFKTEFSSEGINQTKHTIYIEVKCTVTTIAPFITDNITCDSRKTVAETIIVGDIPDNYYNIENLKDASENGASDIIP